MKSTKIIIIISATLFLISIIVVYFNEQSILWEYIALITDGFLSILTASFVSMVTSISTYTVEKRKILQHMICLIMEVILLCKSEENFELKLKDIKKENHYIFSQVTDYIDEYSPFLKKGIYCKTIMLYEKFINNNDEDKTQDLFNDLVYTIGKINNLKIFGA